MLLSFLRKKIANRKTLRNKENKKKTDGQKDTNSFHDFLSLINTPFTNNGPNLSKFSSHEKN